MNPALAAMHAADWLHLFGYFLSVSLLTVGGAIATSPDMYRVLVGQQAWLTPAQFNNSVAIAQAAPGPNVLFIALLGLQIGINASAGQPAWVVWAHCALAVACTMLGVLLPSSLLMLGTARWIFKRREHRALRAFKQGLAPIVIGMMLATALVLASNHGSPRQAPGLWLLSVATMLLVWRTRWHLLWWLGMGAVLGALGWV
ncbi:Chromate transporter [compost metagenome]